MNIITEIFSYPFAVRAAVAGILISVCAALLGVNLVLKRFSMLGDGLSHVSFGAAAVALAVGAAPLKVSVPVVIIAAFLLLRMNGNSKIRGDAAIALVSSSALAIGVIVASMTTGMNTDISNYMFGSILTVSRSDVVLAILITCAVAVLYIFFYEKVFSCAFDESFAAATGVRVKLYNSVTAVLTAITVVVGMRIMGALLISSIITFPALSAMRVCKKYSGVMAVSCIVAAVSFAVGLAASFVFNMPAGAAVVVADLAVFLVFTAFSKARQK